MVIYYFEFISYFSSFFFFSNRILSSVSSLKVPDNFELFPPKLFGWFPEPDGTIVDVIKALEYTVIQGGVEW